MKKINTTNGYVLYVKHFGELANNVLIDLLGTKFNTEDRIMELGCRGIQIKVVMLTDDEVRSLIEYQGTQALKFDAYIGRPGEREVVPALLGIRCGDVTFKEKLQEAITAHFEAFKLAQKVSRYMKPPIVRHSRITGSLP